VREIVGQLDPLFAERLQPGDRFLLDGRCLEFRRREEGLAVVEEVMGRPQVPRWGGDGWPLSGELAHRLFLLRVQAAEALRDGPQALAELLRRDFHLQEPAAALLVDYFQRQESVSEIPDPSCCLIEAVRKNGGEEYYIHTPLNRLGNDALARVAVHRLARDHGRSALPLVADLGFALLVRGSLPAPADVTELLRQLLAEEHLEADLEALLAGSDALRERFQRVAQTGLMLLRNPLGRRRSVGGRTWGQRQLFEQVRAHDPDFVLLRQALRELRAEWCDARSALEWVRRLPGQPVRCRWLGRPSPFVESWTQPVVGESEPPATPAEALQRLQAELLGLAEGA
jgi:ATP-dependent Lhr-like helicase